jgi:hypothetical protein
MASPPTLAQIANDLSAWIKTLRAWRGRGQADDAMIVSLARAELALRGADARIRNLEAELRAARADREKGR